MKHATRHTYGWLLTIAISIPAGLAFGAWLA